MVQSTICTVYFTHLFFIHLLRIYFVFYKWGNVLGPRDREHKQDGQPLHLESFYSKKEENE